MSKLLSLTLLFIAATGSAAKAAKPGDSVDSGHRLRNGQFEFRPETVERFFPVFDFVPLGSQTEGDYFTDYGPYTNISDGVVRIMIKNVGGADWNGIVGWVNGAEVANNSRSVVFTAGPGDRFGFSVKDFANIAVYHTTQGIEEGQVGIPSAEDFRQPKGTLVRCTSFAKPSGEIMGTEYIYIEGSLSDKSRRIVSQNYPGLTVGPIPPQPVSCEIRVEDAQE